MVNRVILKPWSPEIFFKRQIMIFNNCNFNMLEK
jgi:hypothetical protein